ncbi:putative carboxylic ester hydrolase [Lupinus albus]|uniref:Putative carboxylic ester hydrolase n=1 Tax=Lupinus albus TaxID=3870 RepID=A0A6A4QH99_LUPAL|nr:putative carboxylic ester hydrolase [Lupinus albus]
MMQMHMISSTIPAHNLHMFQTRRASFTCQASPLNPSRAATGSTRLHLSNLDKLLQKQSDESSTQLNHEQNLQEKQNHTSTTITEKKGKSALEGLNLARLWPEMKAAEEMSPRHLNRLQRLLSMSAEHSPRNVLGSMWREYHGSNDWKGMLDPLDENLRREVVRYGEFVQAAYHSFHSNPTMSSEEPPVPRHVVVPDRSYRVTKSLYATSSIGLPGWVDDMAPNLGWMTQRSSWIGYVAVCDDRREIARLGRRDIVISLRGTATCLEWAENMRVHLIDMSEDESLNVQEKSKVEHGFLSLYKTRGTHVPSLAESVIEEVKRLMEVYKGEALSITITGHSLGAALALLVADEISTCSQEMPPVAVFSFGGPRVGNKAFGTK